MVNKWWSYIEVERFLFSLYHEMLGLLVSIRRPQVFVPPTNVIQDILCNLFVIWNIILYMNGTLINCMIIMISSLIFIYISTTQSMSLDQ